MLLTNNHGFKVYLEQISELVTKFNYTLSLETNFTSRTSLFPLLPGKMTVISNFSLGWQLSVTYSTLNVILHEYELILFLNAASKLCI